MEMDDWTKKEEMLRYFDRPVFRRLFEEVRKKYQSLGRVGGKVLLPELSVEERETLGGFLGQNLLGQTGVVVELARVEAILRQSRFQVDLESFLADYFGVPMIANAARAAAETQEWEDFCQSAAPWAGTPVTREWLDLLCSGQGTGYRTLRALYQEDKMQARVVLGQCLAALGQLPADHKAEVRTPVYAARLTGDPHALDGDTPLGRLFFYGLLFVLGVPEADFTAERKRGVFQMAGLAEDDVSSNVLVAGLQTWPGDPRADLFRTARETSSPLILPLRFFAQTTRWSPPQALYVVENPSVFSTILDAWDLPGMPSLVCTSGQPSVAAIRLLDEMVHAGARIYYSGDFDVKGLEMGVALFERYGHAFQPWFFDTGSYLRVSTGVPLTPEQVRRLSTLQVPWDPQLPQAIVRQGLIVYQELLVEDLIKDTRSCPNMSKNHFHKGGGIDGR